VFGLTPAGAVELREWLSALISTPARDYTAFEAGLSFLPALAPGAVVELLHARAAELEGQLAEHHGSRGLGRADVPRVFWVDEEYRDALRRAELDYVRRLAADIEAGALAGQEWWAQLHQEADA